MGLLALAEVFFLFFFLFLVKRVCLLHYERKIQYLKGLLRDDPTVESPFPDSADFDSTSEDSDGSVEFS